jgi:hypothetical protein
MSNDDYKMPRKRNGDSEWITTTERCSKQVLKDFRNTERYRKKMKKNMKCETWLFEGRVWEGLALWKFGKRGMWQLEQNAFVVPWWLTGVIAFGLPNILLEVS